MSDNYSYGIFAQYYDKFTEDVEYEKRGGYYHRLARELGCPKGGVLLDLACGTGSFSQVFDELGYDVIGVDNSEEMLSVAARKRSESGRNIQYVLQDMRELELPGEVDVTVCALDSLNHLDGIEDIREVFRRVFEHTADGGVFLFDMNTIYKHRSVLGNNTMVYETEDVFFVWQNQSFDNRVDIYLDFFIPGKDGSYNRYSEDFSEIAYPPQQVQRELEQAGFKVMGIYAENSFDPPREDTQRIVFAAKKQATGG